MSCPHEPTNTALAVRYTRTAVRGDASLLLELVAAVHATKWVASNAGMAVLPCVSACLGRRCFDGVTWRSGSARRHWRCCCSDTRRTTRGKTPFWSPPKPSRLAGRTRRLPVARLHRNVRLRPLLHRSRCSRLGPLPGLRSMRQAQRACVKPPRPLARATNPPRIAMRHTCCGDGSKMAQSRSCGCIPSSRGRASSLAPEHLDRRQLDAAARRRPGVHGRPGGRVERGVGVQGRGWGRWTTAPTPASRRTQGTVYAACSTWTPSLRRRRPACTCAASTPGTPPPSRCSGWPATPGAPATGRILQHTVQPRLVCHAAPCHPPSR